MEVQDFHSIVRDAVEEPIWKAKQRDDTYLGLIFDEACTLRPATDSDERCPNASVQ
jgi:hypothetical protein